MVKIPSPLANHLLREVCIVLPTCSVFTAVVFVNSYSCKSEILLQFCHLHFPIWRIFFSLLLFYAYLASVVYLSSSTVSRFGCKETTSSWNCELPGFNITFSISETQCNGKRVCLLPRWSVFLASFWKCPQMAVRLKTLYWRSLTQTSLRRSGLIGLWGWRRMPDVFYRIGWYFGDRWLSRDSKLTTSVIESILQCIPQRL